MLEQITVTLARAGRTAAGLVTGSGGWLMLGVLLPATLFAATLSTTSIDFGTVVPGLSVTQKFTVTPAATSASTQLVVTNESPTGVFTVSPQSRSGTAPFEVTVTFQPNEINQFFIAQIDILDCTEGPVCMLGGTVALQGESEGGSFSVNDGELPVLDFGDVSVGDGSQPLTFRVSATTREQAPLAIQVSTSSLALKVTPSSFQVYQNKSQDVSVVFAPTTPGPVNGQLTVTGKFAASGFDVPIPVTITATGNGQAQLAIATSSIDPGTVGRPYNEPLSGAGGDPPYQWSLTSGELPPGLDLLPDGSIQGTPEASGVWAVTLTLTDASGVAVRRDFQITIANPLMITTESLPPGAVGVAYNQSVVATGGIPPLQWARLSGTLPDGLFLTASGAINGTPSSAGSWTVALRVTDSVGVEASREWTIRITDEGSQTEPPQVTAMVNAASFAAGLAVTPGSLVSIFGTGLASDIAGATSIPIATQLLDTRVLLNGIPAPLLYVTPGGDGNPAQINAQVPWEVLGGGGASSGNLTLVVEVGGVPSESQEVPVAEFSPGIFTIQFGIGQAVAANALTGVWAAPPGVIAGATPIQRGEYLSIWCTGLGAVNPPAETGNNSLDQTRFTLTAPTVLFGEVATAGLAAMSPEFVGVYQVNVPVPENAPVGDAVPLRIRVGEYTSRDDVTVAIQ